MKISQVKRIDKDCILFTHRAQIDQYVENPLRDACKLLWDKNIYTFTSSANEINIGNNAVIGLSYDKLSDENKRIVQTMIQEGNAHFQDSSFSQQKNVYLLVPVNAKTSVDEVAKQMIQLTQQLKKQHLTWGFRTPSSLFEQENIMLTPQLIVQGEKDGYVYDSKRNVFWESIELYKKSLD